jgi:hypothetical protein
MQPVQQQPSLGRLDSTSFAFLRSDSLERNPTFALPSMGGPSMGDGGAFAAGGALQRQLSFDPLRMDYLTAAAAANPAGAPSQGYGAPPPLGARTRAHGGADGTPSARALHAVRQTASFKPERGAAKVRRRARAAARPGAAPARRNPTPQRTLFSCCPLVSLADAAGSGAPPAAPRLLPPPRRRRLRRCR